jgi:putative flippase GtrA
MATVKHIAKYLIAGGTAAGVDLIMLHVFTDWLGIWYLYSATLAFFLALGISFTLQKFWVFKNRSCEKIKRQAIMHFSLGAISTGVNAGLMYLLVSGLNLHYLLAQIIGGALIAVVNFFIYREIIFKSEVCVC